MQDFTFQYRLLVYLTNLTVVFFEILKKALKMEIKALKMTSQLAIFRAFFFFFSVYSTLNLKKKSCKSTDIKNLSLRSKLFAKTLRMLRERHTTLNGN